MAKALRFGNTIVCEHIAAGGGNKATLINVYSGDIVVATMPATLMLAFYIEMLLEPGQPAKVVFEIRQGRNVIATIMAETDPSIVQPIAIIALPSAAVSFDGDVDLSVWAKVEGYRDTKALSKKVFKGTIPA